MGALNLNSPYTSDRWDFCYRKIHEIVNHKYFVPLCLLSGILVRVIWISLFDVKPVSDFIWYYRRGIGIAGGLGYTVGGSPTAYWPVGYPGFLGAVFFAFGGSLLYAKVANIILYMGIAILTYLTSKRIYHNEYAARITLLILAFYPNHIAYSSLVASEIFFTFLLGLGALLLICANRRMEFVFLSGVFWGLAVLTKPQAVFIPLIFLLVFFTDRRSFFKSCAVVYLLILLILAPWIRRNNIHLNIYTLSTNGGINLLIGNSPYSDGSWIWNREFDNLLNDADNEVERDRKAGQIAVKYIAEHPAKTILSWPLKIFYLYVMDVDGISRNQAGIRRPQGNFTKFSFLFFKSVAQLYYMLSILLLFFSIPQGLHRQKQGRIGLILILYFTLIAIVFFGTPRFHFPIIPWMAIYSGIGAEVILKRRNPAFPAEGAVPL